jgi:hypothetical protein
MAQETCPQFCFERGDLTQDPVVLRADYDCVVTLEFLQHVVPDVEILGMIRPGTKVFASVPDFPYISHVRHFATEQEVADRYAGLFSEFRVDAFLNAQRRRLFSLLKGSSDSPATAGN